MVPAQDLRGLEKAELMCLMCPAQDLRGLKKLVILKLMKPRLVMGECYVS